MKKDTRIILIGGIIFLLHCLGLSPIAHAVFFAGIITFLTIRLGK